MRIRLFAEFRDARTGSVMTLIEGEGTTGAEDGEIRPESPGAGLEQTIREWGQRIGDGLEAAQDE